MGEGIVWTYIRQMRRGQGGHGVEQETVPLNNFLASSLRGRLPQGNPVLATSAGEPQRDHFRGWQTMRAGPALRTGRRGGAAFDGAKREPHPIVLRE